MISPRHILLAGLCLAWILPGLIGHDPWKPDEAYTFGVVYELLNGGSWIVPHLAGELVDAGFRPDPSYAGMHCVPNLHFALLCKSAARRMPSRQ